MSVDGGLNANVVNNYSFDGVYLKHSMRARGTDRWCTQANPLRFLIPWGLAMSTFSRRAAAQHSDITRRLPLPTADTRVTLPAGRRGAM